MSSDEELVAFNPDDADLILSQLEGVGGESIAPTQRPRRGDKFAKTVAAIAADATGNCYLRIPTDTGWTDSAASVLVWNESGAAIPAGKKVILFTIDGRWCVFDVCP